MPHLIARFCLGLACLLVIPATAQAQLSPKRAVSKRTPRKAAGNTHKRPSRRKMRKTVKRPRRHARGGRKRSVSGRRSAPKAPKALGLSGGLLAGGMVGSTVFNATEHDTSVGIFGEYNLRVLFTRHLSLGGHLGAAHNRVRNSSIRSIVLGSAGVDLAYHFGRNVDGLYLRGGGGLAFASFDPTVLSAPSANGRGWYAKAGIGYSMNIVLIEGSCTQYTFNDVVMPSKTVELMRCGIALGFGR